MKVVANVIISVGLGILCTCLFLLVWDGSWPRINVAQTWTALGLPPLSPGSPWLQKAVGFAAAQHLGWVGLLASLVGAVWVKAIDRQGFRLLGLWRAIYRAPGEVVRFIVGVLTFSLRNIAKAALILILGAVGWYSFLYYTRERFAADGCDLREQMFPSLQLTFHYECIDVARRTLSGNKVHYVAFFANNESPSPASTGHGWLGLITLTKNEKGTYLLNRREVVGFGPTEASAICQRWIPPLYGRVRPFLTGVPGIQALEARFCVRGILGSEGSSIDSPSGEPIPGSITGTELATMFASSGVTPTVALVARVSAEQFERAKLKIDERRPAQYQPWISDCTTLLEVVGRELGIYIPPRILYPFPSQFVHALLADNSPIRSK